METSAGAGVGTGDRDLVAVLQRWEDCGAVWRVLARLPSGVTVALCRCDGGEEVERFNLARSPAAGLPRRTFQQPGLTDAATAPAFAVVGEPPMATPRRRAAGEEMAVAPG